MKSGRTHTMQQVGLFWNVKNFDSLIPLTQEAQFPIRYSCMVQLLLYSMLNTTQTVLDFFLCMYVYICSLLLNEIWSYGTIHCSKVVYYSFSIRFCGNISVSIKNVLCDVTQMHSIICMKFYLIFDCTY